MGEREAKQIVTMATLIATGLALGSGFEAGTGSGDPLAYEQGSIWDHGRCEPMGRFRRRGSR